MNRRGVEQNQSHEGKTDKSKCQDTRIKRNQPQDKNIVRIQFHNRMSQERKLTMTIIKLANQQQLDNVERTSQYCGYDPLSLAWKYLPPMKCDVWNL